MPSISLSWSRIGALSAQAPLAKYSITPGERVSAIRVVSRSAEATGVPTTSCHFTFGSERLNSVTADRV
jgi:hypothetical protein